MSIKNFITVLLLLFSSCTVRQSLTIGFWNVENLFDLQDDPAKEDDEFTPQGDKQVTREILNLKLNHLTEIIREMNVDILGLAEVENRPMVEMLNNKYKERDYTIIHYESPDVRGIDVALMYDRHRFDVISSNPIPIDLGDHRPTRDILYVEGLYDDERLHLFVNHWPSHWEGTEITNPLRAKAAKVLRQEVNKIVASDPSAEIVIMGDLNDQPTAPSVATYLGCSLTQDSIRVGEPTLCNLMAPFIDKPDGGTCKYEGKDLVYDQIIVSPGLLDTKGLYMLPGSVELVDRPRYRQQEGPFKGYPFRFWAGDSLLGGYSDHLAVKVTVKKM